MVITSGGDVRRSSVRLGFLPDGSLLVVAMMQRRLLRVANGRVEPYADLREFGGDFANDMVVDASVARMSASATRVCVRIPAAQGRGGARLVVVSSPPATLPSRGSLGIANGTVITPDGGHW